MDAETVKECITAGSSKTTGKTNRKLLAIDAVLLAGTPCKPVAKPALFT